VLDLVRL